MSNQEPPGRPIPGSQPPASPPPGVYPPRGAYPPPGPQQPPPSGYPPPYPPPGGPAGYPQPPGYPTPYGAPVPLAREPFDSAPYDIAILGLGFLVLVFSHFAFYRIPAARDLAFNLDAYHGFFGWAGVWLVFLGAAAVAVPLLGRHVSSTLRLVALCVAALGLVLLIITIAVRPDFGFCEGRVLPCTNPVKVGVTYWIDLVLAIGVVGLLGFTLAKERELF